MIQAGLTASGVVCAHGAGAAALWSGLLSGRSQFSQRPELGGDGRAARVPDAALAGPPASDRTDALLREATRQITESPAWSDVDPRRLGVCVGTTQGPISTWSDHQRRLAGEAAHRPPLPGLAEPIHALARRLGARGPVSCPSVACATGTAAIGLGLEWIRQGRCDAVVAGGVDVLSRFVHIGFSSLKALDPISPRPFDRDRAGLGLGEGAGLVLLQRRPGGGGLTLAGWGMSADANHLTGPDPLGRGAARAVREAIADAGMTPAQVDYVNAHGTATVFNDRMESEALSLVFGDDVQGIPVSSIKGAVGHTMAAAGAIEAILCGLVLERGVIPPTAGLTTVDPEIALDVVGGEPRRGDFSVALSTSSGFGGVNAALVLCRRPRS